MPEGLSISKGPAGKDESDLLESGEVDALFHAAEPRAYIKGHPKVARLFPDYRKTERGYFAKTGIFPIMHAVAIRNDIIEHNPWLPKAVFNAYSQAKKLVYDYLKKHARYPGSMRPVEWHIFVFSISPDGLYPWPRPDSQCICSITSAL